MFAQFQKRTHLHLLSVTTLAVGTTATSITPQHHPHCQQQSKNVFILFSLFSKFQALIYLCLAAAAAEEHNSNYVFHEPVKRNGREENPTWATADCFRFDISDVCVCVRVLFCFGAS